MEPIELGAETDVDHGLELSLSKSAQQHPNTTSHTEHESEELRPSGDEELKKTRIAPTKPSTASVINSDTPITYHYLTFATPIPVTRRDDPAGPSVGHLDDNGFVARAPDLSKYTNPLLWPSIRKTPIIAVSCLATLSTAYTAGAYAPMADLWAAEYGVSRLASLTGISAFCMGFALAPMILAPYSEVTGRYPVFVVAGIFFIAFQAVCGVAPNLAAQDIAQFIKGSSASVFSTMIGGVIADLYEKEDRNTPMAVFSGSVLVGTGLGPLIAAIVVEYAGPGWKWVAWHQVIFDVVVVVLVVTIFRESRGSVLLSKKAKTLNKFYESLEARGLYGVWIGSEDSTMSGGADHETTDVENGSLNMNPGRLERIRWLVKEDEQRASVIEMVKTSLTRPFYFLATEPIVFFFSLWVSFAWAVLYLTFASIPLVYRRVYNFSIAQAGYIFVAMIVGGIVATCGGLYFETLLKHPAWQAKSAGDEGDESGQRNRRFWMMMRRKFPVEAPESRLYFTCITSIFLPFGLFLFGFSAKPEIHWVVPAIGIFFAGMGIYFIYLATFNYLADTYQVYASSALAGQSACRNVLGAAFLLVTGSLFTNLGEAAAGGLLGGIATILTVVPWVLVFYGETIRSRSKFAVALNKK